MEVNDLNTKEDEKITESESAAANRNLSINVHGADMYQSCINGLLTQRMLNDNIVFMLLVMSMLCLLK